MFRAHLSILAALVALVGTVFMFPLPASSQTGGAGQNIINNSEFTDSNSDGTATGWVGGRRVNVGGDFAGRILGPAGIMYQTISSANAALLLSQGKGNLTIEFEIESPSTGKSGLLVSLAGRVFNADDYRIPTNPNKVSITFRDNDFRLLGDRTLSFQVKRPGASVVIDNVSVTYTHLGGGDGEVDPTPTINPQSIQPPAGLGQFMGRMPYATPTPLPESGLDQSSLQVSMNPPIIYLSPGLDLTGGGIQSNILINIVDRSGNAVGLTQDDKLYFELADGSGNFTIIDEVAGSRKKINTTANNLSGYAGTDRATLFFLPSRIEDAEIRLLIRVEINTPRQGEDQDLAQPLELSKVIPISVRVKGNPDARGLAPLSRFNRIFVESAPSVE